MSLQKVAEYLITNETTLIYIQGHAWDGGSKNQELNLSEKRSLEVERFLLIHGVKEEQIHRLFYGNARPNSHGFTAYDSALLRRVEFELIIE